jgi:hypothetical protein
MVPRRISELFCQAGGSGRTAGAAHDAAHALCFMGRDGIWQQREPKLETIMRRLGAAISLSAAMLATSTPANAAAQKINANKAAKVEEQRQQSEPMPDTMQRGPRSERMRLAAEALRALHDDVLRIVQSQTTTNQEIILPRGNPLDGTTAPRCVLGNGVTIQTSGGFRPYHPTADCKN